MNAKLISIVACAALTLHQLVDQNKQLALINDKLLQIIVIEEATFRQKRSHDEANRFDHSAYEQVQSRGGEDGPKTGKD
jgi:hypothetical protein